MMQASCCSLRRNRYMIWTGPHHQYHSRIMYLTSSRAPSQGFNNSCAVMTASLSAEAFEAGDYCFRHVTADSTCLAMRPMSDQTRPSQALCLNPLLASIWNVMPRRKQGFTFRSHEGNIKRKRVQEEQLESDSQEGQESSVSSKNRKKVRWGSGVCTIEDNEEDDSEQDASVDKV